MKAVGSLIEVHTDDKRCGKIGIVIMKDMKRWVRDYLQVGNAMEIFQRNNVRFIAINNGIDSKDQNTLEFAPFIKPYPSGMQETSGIKTKGTSGKPVATEAPYGYIKDPDNKDYWIVDKESYRSLKLIFRLFIWRGKIAIR